MQIFRIVVPGNADKVIGFDSLPKRLLEGIDMKEPSGFPRHWKAFLGTSKKLIKGAVFTRQDNTKQVVPDEIVEGPFFYVIDPLNVNSDRERWSEICSFCKRVVPPEIRLLEKIEDMALPLAPDSHSELKLEPEELEEKGAIIPIPTEYQDKIENGKEISIVPEEIIAKKMSCEVCGKTFDNVRALRMHDMRAHQKIGGRQSEKEISAA